MPTVNERCKILRSLNRVYVFEIVLLLVPRLKILRRRGFPYFGIFEKQEAQSSSQETNHNRERERGKHGSGDGTHVMQQLQNLTHRQKYSPWVMEAKYCMFVQKCEFWLELISKPMGRCDPKLRGVGNTCHVCALTHVW